jgi:two-component sensor histidine kinase
VVFRELATNASKYGALSVDDGAVAVEWTIDEKDISLSWQEAGGPASKPPPKYGYGTRLVAATVQDLGGRIDYDWRSDGLAVRLLLPLASLDA